MRGNLFITNELTVALLFLSTLAITQSEDAKAYDTNDWIPIHQPEHNIQKKATGRVLTLPEPSPLRFFPEEYRSTRQAEYQQQYLRETSSPVKQRSHHRRHRPKQQFTPQQLEQYYIEQRKMLNDQRHIQPVQESHPYEIAPTKPYNNVKMQTKLLKQTYDGLPSEFLPPLPNHPLQPPHPHHYIFPSNPDSIPLVPEANPLQIPTSQVIPTVAPQQNGPNATVEFYNNLNNYHSSSVRQNKPTDLTTSIPPASKENVQLLYLPFDQLQSHHKDYVVGQTVYRPELAINQNVPIPPIVYHQKDFQRDANHGDTHNHQETLLRNIENDFIKQALQAHKLQEQLENEASTTEAIVKKRKPHQPPLAVYMNGQQHAHATDVVKALKDSKIINVQDTIGPDSPHVFVGPANLNVPVGFSKFDLPYLSSLESNRVERKVDHLPFFVAPLNYKTPPGYEKIPFPPPHVGSVIVNMNSLRSDENKAYNPQYGIPGEALISSTPSFNQQQQNEEIASARPIRQRTRHPQRITTPPSSIITSTHNSVPPGPVYNHQYQSPFLTSTVIPNQKPIVPQTQFNQNKYFPGISLDQLREYQVDKANRPPPIQATTSGNIKQLYNYLESNTDPPAIYNSHDSSPEKRKPKPGFEASSIGPTNAPYDSRYHSNLVSQPNSYTQIVPVTASSTTPQPKLEEFIRLVKVAEEMIIRPQSNDPPPRDIFSIVSPNSDKMKEISVYSKQTKPYLSVRPPNSEKTHNVVEPVNYERLFDVPFATNAEVNQINSAVKVAPEKPDKDNHIELKYVVLEELPGVSRVKGNSTATIKPETHDGYKKFQEAPLRELKGKDVQQQIIIIKPESADINDLVDPSIRQLLTPALLAPTEKPKDIETSTVIPKKMLVGSQEVVELKDDFTTTTVKALRNRGRGGSRYNDKTTTYAPRRNPVRGRTRPRITTTTEQDKDPYTTTQAPRTISTKQRYRTRGRPMISQGYSSTATNLPHTTETTTAAPENIPEEIREDNVKYEVNAYTDGSVSKPQLITRAKNLSPEEEYLISKYNLPYTTAPDAKSERYNVQIVTEKDADAAGDDEVRFSSPRKDDESTTVYTPVMEYAVRSIHRSTEKPRTRQRLRGKTRMSTLRTTTRPTTTEANLDDAPSSVEEFYGFFRPPNFKAPSKQGDAEIAPTSPRILLGLKESSSDRHVDDDGSDERIQVINKNKDGTIKPIQFVGEILPKYTSTEKYFEVTPELTPVSDMYVMTTETPSHTTKRRSRLRYTTKKPIEQDKAKYEELEEDEEEPNGVDEQLTHRSRTRGRVHFKLPVIVTTDGADEADNYPALYLKAQQNRDDYTPQTSPQTEKFKITVEPGFEEESDQEPHASIVSSKFVAPNNHVQSPSNPKELKYLGGKHVHFNGSNFRANLTTVKMVEVELITDPTESTEKPKRRGYWKLVKKKNPDEFDEAESQNFGISRDNDYEREETKHRFTTGESTDDMDDISSTVSDIREEDLLSTTLSANINEDVTKKGYNEKNVVDDDEFSTNKALDVEVSSVNPRLLMDGIRTSTSTSTEISRDAEICSKGICVKSDEYDPDK